jgi:carbon-monoxide dehydrogenase medium subunit
MKQRLVQPAYLIGLRRLTAIDGMNQIAEISGTDANYFRHFRIGALCTHREIEDSPLVHAHFPLLAETFRNVASIRIRTVATLGGAVAHADPNQDPPPSLMALDARVCVRSSQGEREVGISEFFVDYYETILELDEIVSAVIVPHQPAHSGAAFFKFLPQTHDDYATVAVAARVTLDGNQMTDARVALGAASATPIRATAVEDGLQGQQPTTGIIKDAAALVADAVDPTDDFRGSAAYKRDMAVVFVQRAVEQAVARAKERGGQI